MAGFEFFAGRFAYAVTSASGNVCRVGVIWMASATVIPAHSARQKRRRVCAQEKSFSDQCGNGDDFDKRCSGSASRFFRPEQGGSGNRFAEEGHPVGEEADYCCQSAVTDTEATKFWPIYDQYTAELVKVNDAKYARSRNMRRTTARSRTIQALSLDRQFVDSRSTVAQLRLKYVPIVNKVYPG